MATTLGTLQTAQAANFDWCELFLMVTWFELRTYTYVILRCVSAQTEWVRLLHFWSASYGPVRWMFLSTPNCLYHLHKWAILLAGMLTCSHVVWYPLPHEQCASQACISICVYCNVPTSIPACTGFFRARQPPQSAESFNMPPGIFFLEQSLHVLVYSTVKPL